MPRDVQPVVTCTTGPTVEQDTAGYRVYAVRYGPLPAVLRGGDAVDEQPRAHGR